MGRHLFTTALFGAGTALSHAPLSLWPALYIGFAGFFWAMSRGPQTTRANVMTGFAFGVGYFLITMNWIVEPFMVDARHHGWMAPFALVGMAAGLALFWGLAALGWVWGRSLGLAVGLALAEYGRAHVFGGFPWGMPAYGTLDGFAAHWASIIGPFGLNFMVFLLSAALANLIKRPTIKGFAVVAPLAAVLVSPLVWQSKDTSDTGVTVRLVQPNAQQDRKWDPRYAPMFFDQMLQATEIDPPADIIVWPESAITALLNYAPDELAKINNAGGESPVILGILRIDENDDLKNALAVVTSGGIKDVYDKTRLVPFGEYMPLEHVLRPIGLGIFYDWFGNAFAPGGGPKSITLDNGLTFAPLICYEAIFPDYVRQSAQNADFLVQITNDGWFGTISGPHQHLAQARLRSIETGLPMVRVSNTGVSTVIDSFGNFSDALPFGQVAWGDFALPNKAPTTIYLEFGDIWFLALIIFATFVRWIARRGDNLLTN